MKKTFAFASVLVAVQAQMEDRRERGNENNHVKHPSLPDRERGEGTDETAPRPPRPEWGHHGENEEGADHHRRRHWDREGSDSGSHVGHRWEEHFDGSDLSDKWFENSESGIGQRPHLRDWDNEYDREDHNDRDDDDNDDDDYNRHRRHRRHHSDGDDHDDREDRHHRDHNDRDDDDNDDDRRGHHGRYHDDDDDNDDDGNDYQGPLRLAFPFLFPQPVEFLGGRLEMINEVAANLADRLDFLQEIRIVFACPSESCIDGCPETEELRQQAGCIVPREATPLQSGPEGESVVVIEVVIMGMPSPEDIQIMHEMLMKANLVPVMEPTDVMNAISDENQYHDHHHHHHHHHRALKIAFIAGLATIIILSVALCCCCCKKRKMKRCKAARVSVGDVEAPQVMQAIPVPAEAMLNEGTFIFDEVVKPPKDEVTENDEQPESEKYVPFEEVTKPVQE